MKRSDISKPIKKTARIFFDLIWEMEIKSTLSLLTFLYTDVPIGEDLEETKLYIYSKRRINDSI